MNDIYNRMNLNLNEERIDSHRVCGKLKYIIQSSIDIDMDPAVIFSHELFDFPFFMLSAQKSLNIIWMLYNWKQMKTVLLNLLDKVIIDENIWRIAVIFSKMKPQMSWNFALKLLNNLICIKGNSMQVWRAINVK